MKATMTPHRLLGLLAWAVAASFHAPATAQDLSWSGFGTLGYARSNADYGFQRFIDREGSLARDSLLALQVDARLNAHWSATVQLKAAPSQNDDDRWDVSASWAFVAWRPDNDWLLRAGRLRVPLYLYSETKDIGAATDLARLPNEMYWIAPTSDFTGLYATRNWMLGEREVSVDGYSGYADTTLRQWSRNGLPPQLSAGERFTDVRVRSTGLVLTVRDTSTLWRAGLHRTRTTLSNDTGFTIAYPHVDLAPGLGYWQVSNALPGPGIPTVGTISNQIFTAGIEMNFGQGWRVAAEGARVRQQDTEIGFDAAAGYVALFKSIGRFTPYATASRILSSRQQRDWQARLSQADLPPFIPGAAQLVAAQRTAADFVQVYDQHSLALGLSYQLSPGAKLKAEWMRSHIGAASSMTDAPPGTSAPRNTSLDVLSFNYSFAF